MYVGGLGFFNSTKSSSSQTNTQTAIQTQGVDVAVNITDLFGKEYGKAQQMLVQAATQKVPSQIVVPAPVPQQVSAPSGGGGDYYSSGGGAPPAWAQQLMAQQPASSGFQWKDWIVPVAAAAVAAAIPIWLATRSGHKSRRKEA